VFVIAIVLESKGNKNMLNLYTIVTYPLSAFYRNAPDYGWPTGSALLASMGMAYLGLTQGFGLQRRILRSREGKKR
jgi:hypothetical protein